MGGRMGKGTSPLHREFSTRAGSNLATFTIRMPAMTAPSITTEGGSNQA